MMLLKHYLSLNVFITVFVIIKTQSLVDTPCTVNHNGANGVCKVDRSCPKAREDAERGIRPTICEILINSILVVCCEGAQVTNVQANENSFLNVDNGNSDGIVYESDAADTNMPISEQKCAEYNKNTIYTVDVIPLVSDPIPSSILIVNCSYDGLPLVLGGKPALAGEFPFMALLGYTGSDDEVQWNCGGTLISEYFVMTAAHCVITKRGRPVLIRLGELDLTTENDNSSPRNFGVGDIKAHPNYHPLSKFNDIALIRLSAKVTFTKFIRPACLWNQRHIGRRSAIATGWGATTTGGPSSDVLQKVSLDILDKSICDRTYGNIKYYKDGLPKTMLCAGELRGGKDTCQGDSGGPLTISKEGNRCIFYTIAITSVGIKCGLENTPAIYTRVSEFIPWIEETVWGSRL